MGFRYTFNMAIVAAVCPLLFLATVVFYARRKLHPIVGRLPTVVVSTNVLLVSYLLFVSIVEIQADRNDKIYCRTIYWYQSVHEFAIFLAYLLRTWNLFVRNSATYEQLQYMDRQQGRGREDSLLSLSRVHFPKASSESVNLSPPPHGHTPHPSSSSHQSNQSKQALVIVEVKEDEKDGTNRSRSRSRSRSVSKRSLSDVFAMGAVGFWSSQRFLSKVKYNVIVAVVVWVLLLIPLIYFTETDSQLDGNNVSCSRSTRFIASSCILGSIALCFAILAYKLRSVVDNYLIKTELRAAAWLGVAAIVCSLFLHDEKNGDGFNYQVMTVQLIIPLVIVIGTVQPTVRTWSPPQVIAHTAESVQTLEGLLKAPGGRRAFERFLAIEFAVENLFFYDEVKLFKETVLLPNMLYGECMDLAEKIFDNFIVNDAPYEINVSSLVRQSVTHKRNVFREGVALGDDYDKHDWQALAVLFDEPLKEVVELLRSDKFIRFRSHFIFVDFVQRLEKHNSIVSRRLLKDKSFKQPVSAPVSGKRERGLSMTSLPSESQPKEASRSRSKSTHPIEPSNIQLHYGNHD